MSNHLMEAMLESIRDLRTYTPTEAAHLLLQFWTPETIDSEEAEVIQLCIEAVTTILAVMPKRRRESIKAHMLRTLDWSDPQWGDFWTDEIVNGEGREVFATRIVKALFKQFNLEAPND